MIILLDNFLDFIDKLNAKVANIAMWLVLILSGALFLEVVLRYGFDKPTVWSYDISYMLGGVFFTLGMGYTLQIGRHVRVDVFYNTWRKRTQKIVDVIFTTIVFFPTFGLLLSKLVPLVIRSWQTQERSVASFWMPIIYPFRTMLLIAVILLILQQLAIYIRDWRYILSKKYSDKEVE